MGTLADCLTKVGITGTKAKYITEQAAKWKSEGFDPQTAHVSAVKELLAETRKQQRSVVKQLQSKLTPEQMDAVFPAIAEKPPTTKGATNGQVQGRTEGEVTPKKYVRQTPPEGDPTRESWQEMSQKAREKELALSKEKNEVDTKLSKTRRSATKLRREMQNGINHLQKRINEERKVQLLNDGRLREAIIEDYLENPKSEEHRLAGMAELSKIRADNAQSVFADSDAAVKLRQDAEAYTKQIEDAAEKYAREGDLLNDDEVHSIVTLVARDFDVASKRELREYVGERVAAAISNRKSMSLGSELKYLTDDQKQTFRNQIEELTGKDWYSKLEKIRNDAMAANVKAKEAADAEAAKAREEGQRKQAKVNSERMKGLRNRARVDSVNDKYWKELAARSRKLKGKDGEVDIHQNLYEDAKDKTKVTGSKKIPRKAEILTPEMAITIEQKEDGGKKEFSLTHTPTGLSIASSSQANLRQLAQLIIESGIDMKEVRSSGVNDTNKRLGKIVKAWDNSFISELPEDLTNKIVGSFAETPTKTKADIVLNAADLGAYGGTGLKEGATRVKEIAKAAPEFAYEPVFIVNDKKQLVFKDGVTYTLSPAIFNLDPDELTEGQTVGINIEDLGIEPLTAEGVVIQSLKNWGFGNVRSDKKGGVTASWGGAKVQLSGNGDQWTVSGDDSLKSVQNAKNALKKIHWLADGKAIAKAKPAVAALKASAENVALPPLQPKTKLQAKTSTGRKLLKSLQNDSGTNKVGLRSINDYLMELAHTVLFIGNTQTSKRNPAHYLGKVNSKGRPTGFGPHIIRSRNGYTHLNVHEVGHAISGYLASLDPRWHKSIASDLIKLTKRKGSVASAENAEEGWAELVRRYVILPNTLPKNLTAEFETTLAKYNPDMLDGLQDAQVAYAYHRSRPIAEQMATLMNDKGRPSGLGGQIKDLAYRALFSTIGGDVILHRLYRRGWRGLGGDNALTGFDPTGLLSKARTMIDKAYAERQWLAKRFYGDIKDTPADMESAYQSMLHVPEESGRAIIGDARGREGIRVRATGDGLDALPKESLDALREAGFKIPDASVKHGGWVYLYDKSFDAIKNAVGKENWQAFETWGQYRAALHRHETKGHEYPLINDGLTPEVLRTFIDEQQAAHPDWDKHFKEVNEFMDQLLLVPVLSGEFSVSEAISIKNAWGDYWPLPRQVEGKGISTGGGGTEPSAGVRSAYGSQLPFRTLTEAVETRVKSAMEAYYTNRMMLAVKNYGNKLDVYSEKISTGEGSKTPLAPFDVRKEAVQLMLPLKMEMKAAAKLTVREQQEIAAKAINQRNAEEMGVSVSELDPDQIVQPEDVAISTPGKVVWRSTKPRAANVVRVFEKGSAKYYQIPDPLLFDFFAHSRMTTHSFIRWMGKTARGITNPWKRLVTQNLVFAITNAAARDPFTAASLSKAETKKTLVPGYLLATGVVNRMTGGNLDAVSQSELLSRSLDQTTSKPHQKWVDNFKEMLTEGIVPPNYSDMPWYDKAGAAPGQVMSAILKVGDVFNYVTGGRALSKLGEEATREGAYITAIREGASDERAQLAYDQITGNFGQRGGSPGLAEMIRAAGFLNPAIQIMWGGVTHVTHPDPAVRSRYIAAKLPLIATVSGLGAAINVLAIKAMYDDDDADEILAQMSERRDEDRMSSMTAFGKIRLPFDYGPVGAVQSYAWNAVESWILKSPVDSTVRSKELLRRAFETPGLTDTLPPHAKMWIELSAGPTGHSFFYNDDIVPAWLVDKYRENPELRKYPETPQAYQKLGEFMGVSPMKVQYAVTNGLSREMGAMLTTIERPNKDASDIVIIGRLLQKESSGFNAKSVLSLMDLDYQYTRLKEAVDNEKDADKRKELQEQMAQLEVAHAGATLVDKVWQTAKEMREGGDMDGYKKVKRIMVGMGRDILGAPPLKGYPDPWNSWNEMPAEVQESINKYVELRAEESLRGAGKPDRKDDESDAAFADRVEAWKAKRARSTEWLANHKKTPAVQSVIAEVKKKIPPEPMLKFDSLGVAKNSKQVKEWRERYGSAGEAVKSLTR